jgi:hypothetical protein
VVAAFGRALRSGGWLVIVDETYPTTLAESSQDPFRVVGPGKIFRRLPPRRRR